MTNLRSSLKARRRAANPMQEYDCLPSALRLWLQDAALPWSAPSAKRAWRNAMKQAGGCEKRAMSHMARLETKSLQKDAPHVWGDRYPGINRAAAR
ncbi:hypothetical protein SAMN04488030_2710 [Aliiroseovarius halocynthiae]|uniref:Uncharacterized protein n=1 Tax=Aliiroseovarius halocynthiae TaxID=985055 RepID=A0A545SPL7_9RHOB|nr:DUF6525 family protein [Aliiroseovarius halocynthiae]TQV66806.1 hypothetical protein FIL88_11960 [Aliiroseovarius halocynthiae]SMR82360.1 hypothetical protein SAMN04488030_2710 [Aliiroseovarius halocynthiae]